VWSIEWCHFQWLWLRLQIEEEERLMQELKKIEQRKKEREKKTLDLQKLITAADSNIEARRPERKTTKKAVVCKVKDTNVSREHYFKHALLADSSRRLSLHSLNVAFVVLILYFCYLVILLYRMCIKYTVFRKKHPLLCSYLTLRTRGQSNLTKSASRGAHSPFRGHPRGGVKSCTIEFLG